ncbi:MAG: SIMPL domain-containing protein [Patescibacteria group bacterium]
MEQKIKNYVGWAIIFALVVVSVSAWMYVGSYAKQIDPASMRTFSVSADGKVVSIPDVATFTFSVITEGGKNLGDLQKQNVEKVNKAIAFVKENKVEEKDIKTEQYSVEPRYQYANCGMYGGSTCPPPTIVGYTVRQSVLVKVRDFEKAGDIIGGVVEQGANSVSQLQFTIDDPTKILADAREQAIEKAKEKAEQIADAAGFSVGKLISIDEGGYYPTPMYRNMKVSSEVYGMGGGDMAAAPSIEPGSQEVTTSVTLRYEIK